MSVPSDLLEVGRIGKAHGLRGDVVVTLTTDRLERIEPGSCLHDGHGDLVVVSSRPHQGKWLVMFEGVGDRSQAERLRGRVLYAAPLDDEGVLWVHELVGARVVDQVGVDRGLVESVLANPAADLLALESGALIPVTFVVELADGVASVDVPDGLFELYE